MDSVVVEFPITSLKIRDPSVAPFYYSGTDHEATNGMRRTPVISGAQWRMRFSVVIGHVDDEETKRQVRAFRAFTFWMEGSSTLVRVRMPDLYGIDGPFAVDTKAIRNAWPNGVPFATGAMYETGAGHAVPTLETYFETGASLGARDIYVTAAAAIPAGCAISIDEYCYGIAGSWIENGRQWLRLSPPLRKPASAGDTISLAPVFVGHCITENPGYEALTLGKAGTHTLEFVEDLTRLAGDFD